MDKNKTKGGRLLKKPEVKIFKLFMSAGVLLVLIVAIFLGGFNLVEGNRLQEEQASRQLTSVVESKAERVQGFLDNRKADAVFLSESSLSARILKGEIVRGLDKELETFSKEKGYSDLIFINPEGDVVWTAQKKNELGTNLVTGIYNESLLASMFNKVVKDLSVSVSDSKEYGQTGELMLFVTAPVLDADDILVGVVALQLENNRVADLLVGDVGLGELGEVYIVNRELRHISPLRFDDDSNGGYDMIEITVSDRILSCFVDYDNYYLERRGAPVDDVLRVGKGENYVGHDVLNAHAYILESGWCIIAEIDEQEFFGVIPRVLRFILMNIVIVLALLLIISFAIGATFSVGRRGK